jgi:hypothetical protein
VSVLIAVNISISAALISGIAFYVLVPIVYALICLRMNQTQR